MKRTTDSVNGRVSLRLALKGEGVDGPQLLPSLKGYGSIAIDPIDLDGSALLNELTMIKEIPRQGRVGSVSSDEARSASRGAPGSAVRSSPSPPARGERGPHPAMTQRAATARIDVALGAYEDEVPVPIARS